MSGQYIPNYPRALSLDFFRSVNEKFGSLAKSARFVARIVPRGNRILSISNSNPAFRELLYLCEAAEYPGRGFMNVDLRYYGPSFKLPYQSTYEDINMTFLCRNESYERQFFDDWMGLINPNNTFDFNYRDEYKCQIEIFQIADYSESAYGINIPGVGLGTVNNFDPAKATYSFTLLDAYPILINPQQVTWADDQFLRLGVTFTYHWWTRFSLDDNQGIVNQLGPITYNIP